MIQHRVFDSLNATYIKDNIEFMDLCIETALEDKNEEIADIFSLLINDVEKSHITPYNHLEFIHSIEDSLEYVEFYERNLKTLIKSFIVKIELTNKQTIALN